MGFDDGASDGQAQAGFAAFVARAALAAGADGLIIEVHPQPEATRCDALQALSPGAFATLMDDARSLVELDGRPLVTGPSHEVRESSGSQAMGA